MGMLFWDVTEDEEFIGKISWKYYFWNLLLETENKKVEYISI
jgi:hypothetical protein